MLVRRKFLAALGASAAASIVARARGFAPTPPPDLSSLAHDPNRPEYHFLAPHNWMNDPNGPIWWKGKFHLFYQLNPNAAVWGDMHWGHAISADMMHWRHEPIALAPTPEGPDSAGCFSGSAVVRNGVPTFIYTGVQTVPREEATLRDAESKYRETQLLATAEDGDLLHWKKLAKPIIAAPPPGMALTGFRDPCPWREADGWYLAVGSGVRSQGGCVLLYRSQDLRQWEYLHPLVEGKASGRAGSNPVDTGEMWECPDFFELNGTHCLLYSTEGKVYWSTGDYDPNQHRYTPRRQGVLDRGAYYAPKSFVAPGGRRILWGWIQETRPEAEYSAAGWAGAMSLPRQLSVGGEGQLEMRPAVEVETLRDAAEHATLKPGDPFRRKLASLRHELHVPLGLWTGALTARLIASGAPAWELTIDVRGNAVRCGEISFPLPSLPWPHPDLRLFLDGSVIESFIGEREALTSRVYSLKPGETEFEISVTGDRSVQLEHWPLAAISPDRLTT
jgi:beta-fructofuranosidase